MARFNSPLSDLKIASPCSADWEQMIGSERVRYCGQCKLNVYNLSDMSKGAAEALIEQTEGRLCVRFYRRADGTILNRNCPVGLKALKRRLKRVTTAVISAIFGFTAGLGLDAAFFGQDHATPRQTINTTMGTMVSRGPELDVVRPYIEVESPPVPEVGALISVIGKVRVTPVASRWKHRSPQSGRR